MSFEFFHNDEAVIITFSFIYKRLMTRLHLVYNVKIDKCVNIC